MFKGIVEGREFSRRQLDEVVVVDIKMAVRNGSEASAELSVFFSA
jgi:hypothetical protein